MKLKGKYHSYCEVDPVQSDVWLKMCFSYDMFYEVLYVKHSILHI